MNEPYASYRSDQYLSCTVRPQRKFRVVMCGENGDVSMVVEAGSIETVIDQVENRRLATPPGMNGFSVSEVMVP